MFFCKCSRLIFGGGAYIWNELSLSECGGLTCWSNLAKLLPFVRACIVSGHLTQSGQFFKKCKSFYFLPQVRWKCEPAVLGENLLNMSSMLYKGVLYSGARPIFRGVNASLLSAQFGNGLFIYIVVARRPMRTARGTHVWDNNALILYSIYKPVVDQIGRGTCR
jgi:hypothetical protein